MKLMRPACWIAIVLAACPALAAEAPRPSDAVGPAPIATRQNVFAIPFRVDSTSGKQALEVQLYVSADAGATWQLAAKVPPTAGRFKFAAPHDGQYWFMVRTLDQQGVARPSGPPVPELKVIVDTTPPVLELKAQRGNAGEVRAQWRIREANLRGETLTISYRRSGSSDPWQSVATDPLKPEATSLTGEATWWPSTAGAAIAIRAEAADLAGNTTTSQATLEPAAGTPELAGSTEIRPLPPVDGPNAASGQPQAMSLRPLPAVPDASTSVGSGAAGPKPRTERAPVAWPAQRMADPLIQAEAAAQAPQMPSQFPGSRGKPDPQQSVAAAAEKPPASAEPAGRLATRVSSRFSTAAEAVLPPPAVAEEKPPAESEAKPGAPAEDKRSAVAEQKPGAPLEKPAEHGIAPSLPALSPPAAVKAEPPTAATKPDTPRLEAAGSGPALAGEQEATLQRQTVPPGIRPRMVNSRRFELGYDIDALGSDGVSKVELWCTRDGGRTWKCFGTDSDSRSPFPVLVDGEGVYGFRMIVETSSGLRGNPPQPGELPEIWVGVDTSKPVAQLLAAEPRPVSKTTEVFLRWKAEDQLLAARPITLLFSPSPTGPWTVLASGLENSGVYHWRIDARIPDSVYVRLEVRDEAGNLRAVETPEPITIDRIRPHGRILDVRPIEARQNAPIGLR